MCINIYMYMCIYIYICICVYVSVYWYKPEFCVVSTTTQWNCRWAHNILASLLACFKIKYSGVEVCEWEWMHQSTVLSSPCTEAHIIGNESVWQCAKVERSPDATQKWWTSALHIPGNVSSLTSSYFCIHVVILQVINMD